MLPALLATTVTATALAVPATAVPATAVPATAVPAAAAPRHYTVTDLGTLGGLSTEVYDLNNKGVAVGRSLTADGEQHAFSWKKGKMTDLGTLPGGHYAEAHGINEAGVIAGTALNADGEHRAVIWRQGRIVDLGLGRSIGWDINDHGQVLVSRVDDTGAPSSRLIWQNDTVTELGAENSYARTVGKINNEAKVLMLFNDTPTGQAYLGFQQYGSTSGFGPIATPGRNYPNDINNSGIIAGYSTDEQNRIRPVTYPLGPTDLGTLGGPDGYAFAVNDNDVFAGVAQTPDGTSRPVLWQNRQIIDLTTRGLTGNEMPIGINNRGQMIASIDFRAAFIS
jgi:probable HAF family extracellular repeat protein